jgi:flagellar motor switch protein FliN/FliY
MDTKDDTARRRGGATKAEAEPQPLVSIDSALLRNLQVKIEARLGEREMTVDEVTALKPGASLAFDRRLNEPIELYLNGILVARGEIVAVDDHFGVRIVEIADIT